MMPTLFTALALAAAFLLGLRVGLAVGHRNARRELERARRGP
jgi:hypothetical protein